jgi:hypothetical protein
MTQFLHRGLLVGSVERRRTPRYCCAGQAEIICLPSDGSVLAGKLCNLGLGGCYIETVFPFQFGAQTEILVRVNASSFRAMGLVRAIRDRSGIGVQFMRISLGGHAILEDLLFEMARPRVAMSASRLARRQDSSEYLLRPLQDRCAQAIVLQNIPVVGTIIPPQHAEEVPVFEGRAPAPTLDAIARILDIFA